MSEGAVIKLEDQKSMIIIGIVAGVLVVYSAFFAHQLPYSFTQYLGYSFIKFIIFLLIVAVTYASPTIGIAALIALLSTFQYFYMQKSFRRNLKEAGRGLKSDIKRAGRKVKKEVEDALEDDDDDIKEAEIKAEVAETMAAIGNVAARNGGANQAPMQMYMEQPPNNMAAAVQLAQMRQMDASMQGSNNAYARDNSYYMTSENDNYRASIDPRHLSVPVGTMPNQTGQDCFRGDNTGVSFYPNFVNEINAGSYNQPMITQPTGVNGISF